MPVTPLGTSTLHYLYQSALVVSSTGDPQENIGPVVFTTLAGTTLQPRSATTQALLSSVTTNAFGATPDVLLPSDGGPVLATAPGGLSLTVPCAETVTPAQLAALQSQAAAAVTSAQAAATSAAQAAASSSAGATGVDSTARTSASSAQSTANAAQTTAAQASTAAANAAQAAATALSTANSAASTAGTASSTASTAQSSVQALGTRVSTLEAGGGGGGGGGGFNVVYALPEPVQAGDVLRIPCTVTGSASRFALYLPQPPSSGAATAVLDKLPAASGSRLTALSSVSVPANTRLSAQSTTTVTFDPGDELIIRATSALPAGARFQLSDASTALPPLKGTVTGPTISSAVASGGDVVVTATGGSGPWDTVLIRSAGIIVAAITREAWTGSYTDPGQASQDTSYAVGFANRDYAAFSASFSYTASQSVSIAFTAASAQVPINQQTGSDVVTVPFTRAVAVGETVYALVTRSGPATGTALQTCVPTGTGITWDAAPTAANNRAAISGDSTVQGYIAVGVVTTARSSGDTITLTFGGTISTGGTCAVQVFTAKASTGAMLGTVDQANSNTGTGTNPSVGATSTLSGQPSIAVALFVSTLRTVSGLSSTFSSDTNLFKSTRASNDRQGFVGYQVLTATTGIGASVTLSQSSAWAALVAVVKKA